MTLWFTVLALTPSVAAVRDDEIAQCLSGEMVIWGDAQDRPAVSVPLVFVYDHATAPAWFDERLVLASLTNAASHWAECGIAATVINRPAAVASPERAVSVRWSDADSGGNFGLANYGQRTLVLGPAAFQLLRTRNTTHDARETLQMVISHEMGNLFGLMSHSRRCVDVTSSYDNGKGEKCTARDMTQLRLYPEYRSALPTACDIARCKVVNAALPRP